MPKGSTRSCVDDFGPMPAFIDFNGAGAMIEVERICTRRSATVKAVDGVRFVARDGEITGLLGPNGAGKTTTLRMLYTLMRPDAGQRTRRRHRCCEDPMAVRRRLGVLPDARGLYKRLTARENIDYFARLQGLDAATAHDSAPMR